MFSIFPSKSIIAIRQINTLLNVFICTLLNNYIVNFGIFLVVDFFIGRFLDKMVMNV